MEHFLSTSGHFILIYKNANTDLPGWSCFGGVVARGEKEENKGG
jgi:hypothetical protein